MIGTTTVDFERHNVIGVVDADWILSDSDFDGRYDEKILIGYVFCRYRITNR